MKVTIIFKGGGDHSTHKGQEFDVSNWLIHNSYNFLELQFANGSCQQFNLADVFSFSSDKISSF